jgi:hypothetical protein
VRITVAAIWVRYAHTAVPSIGRQAVPLYDGGTGGRFLLHMLPVPAWHPGHKSPVPGWHGRDLCHS